MKRYSAVTHEGHRRDHNEDALLAVPEFGLYLVADGVGGRAYGEVASALTVETFRALAPKIHAARQAYIDQPDRRTRNGVLESLNVSCQAASRRVYEEAESESRRGMTTTLVVAVVGGGTIFLAHVGDSRAYLLREGELLQLSEDHSMVNELVRTGQMTYDEAKRSRYRNVITRAIGLQPGVQADTAAIEILAGDRLLLCSDGLSDPVNALNISRHLGLSDRDQAAQMLLQEALDAGSPDNITVLVVDPDASPRADIAAARAEVMSQVFLFADLSFNAQARVGRMVNDQRVSPGEVVVRQGDTGNRMYVVVQGILEVSRDGLVIATLGPGDHFGEQALVDAQPRSATVRSVGFGSLVTIERQALDEFTKREPEVGSQVLWKLLRTISSRLRDTTSQLAEGRK